MNPRVRKILLFAALGVVVLLAWLAPDSADERGASRVATVAPRADSAAGQRAGGFAEPPSTTAPPVITSTLPQREALGKLRQDMFGYQSWQPPPAPPPKIATAPPPPPVPPPIPYRFAGKTVQDGRTLVYVTRGNHVSPVKEGEVLDGAYRVDAISDTGIAVTYLPLDFKESIAISPRGTSVQGATVLPGSTVLSAPRPLASTPQAPVRLLTPQPARAR